MVTVLLEVILPVAVLLLVVFIARLYVRIQYPSPLAFGCIIPKLCVVASEEILRYNRTGEDEDPAAKHLRRETLWKQFRVNWGYLCEQAWNTTLFQKALRFEIMKIAPATSALEYQPQERLALELLEEATAMRRRLFRAQGRFLVRAMLGLSIDHRVLMALLGQYKQLEQEMIILVGMAGDECYRQMLVERLGLTNWGLLEGGSLATEE